jgi:iron(III) transport system substrate-binding protein
VTFKPFVQPVLVRPQGVGLVYRLKHPATALLFYDYLIGPEGQKVLNDNGSEAARNGINTPELAGAKRYNIDLRPIVSHFKAWSDKYDALMRLGKTK